MRIFCFGDSNTYGYDARSRFGERLPAGERWPEILAEQYGWEIQNEGMNGRKIPGEAWSLAGFDRALLNWGETDLLLIMLGTNDLLGVCFPDMEEVGTSMERFVRHVLKNPQIAGKGDRILLIAPPPTEIGRFGEYGLPFDRESMKFGSCYEKIAEEYGLRFADAGRWGISLAHDGVHFTPEGHGIFAKRLGERIKQQL